MLYTRQIEIYAVYYADVNLCLALCRYMRNICSEGTTFDVPAV